MELIFLEYFFPRLIPHKVKIALSGRYYWKLLNALGQYGLKYKYTIRNLPNASILFKKYIENMQVVLELVFQQQHNLHISLCRLGINEHPSVDILS